MQSSSISVIRQIMFGHTQPAPRLERSSLLLGAHGHTLAEPK